MSTIVRLGRAAFAAGAVAAMVACGNNNSNSAGKTTANPNATPAPAASPASDQARADQNAEPMTVTGCLQQGKRGAWIVTRLNEPSRKGVGTTGSAAAVEHEQLREAENAYRVNPPDDVKMDQLVGKQVKVTGKVTDRGDLSKSANDATGTSGNASANDRNKKADKGLDISQDDLARIDASSITATGAACGGGKARHSTAKTRHSTGAKR
jgi:hypothetical protein